VSLVKTLRLTVDFAHTVRMGPGYCATRESMVSGLPPPNSRLCHRIALGLTR
jgi:hypothetical protein